MEEEQEYIAACHRSPSYTPDNLENVDWDSLEAARKNYVKEDEEIEDMTRYTSPPYLPDDSHNDDSGNRHTGDGDNKADGEDFGRYMSPAYHEPGRNDNNNMEWISNPTAGNQEQENEQQMGPLSFNDQQIQASSPLQLLSSPYITAEGLVYLLQVLMVIHLLTKWKLGLYRVSLQQQAHQI